MWLVATVLDNAALESQVGTLGHFKGATLKGPLLEGVQVKVPPDLVFKMAVQKMFKSYTMNCIRSILKYKYLFSMTSFTDDQNNFKKWSEHFLLLNLLYPC